MHVYICKCDRCVECVCVCDTSILGMKSDYHEQNVPPKKTNSANMFLGSIKFSLLIEISSEFYSFIRSSF